MSVRRDKRFGTWFYRKWVRTSDGRKVRIFGTPKADGLPETRAGAEEAERRAIARVLETGEAKPVTKEVPTIEEAAGLKGYEASSWFGLLAPAGTPADIVTRVQQETSKALATPAMKERLLSQGAIPSGITSAEFAKLIADETRKWAEVVKTSGAKVD